MTINRWWDRDPTERFWLEITDRPDLGTDLNAPQRGDNGREFWSYSLINEVDDGDVVLHYHKQESAIVALSVASGGTWQDVVVWGAHGTSAREAGVEPYPRDGWRLGLENFRRLADPVSLEQIRAAEPDIRTVHEDLKANYGTSLYFPFALSEKRPIRPQQGYLTKFPRGIVEMFRALASVRPAKTVEPPQGSVAIKEVGSAYRPPSELTAISERDPFTIDPALVERALRGHAVTQNLLAQALRERGIEPRSPRPEEPTFDLLWTRGEKIMVAEVKSLNETNQEKQLRLGLGQVLRYRHLLGEATARTVDAVLVVERQATDTSWIRLCESMNVRLWWPEMFDSELER